MGFLSSLFGNNKTGKKEEAPVKEAPQMTTVKPEEIKLKDEQHIIDLKINVLAVNGADEYLDQVDDNLYEGLEPESFAVLEDDGMLFAWDLDIENLKFAFESDYIKDALIQKRYVVGKITDVGSMIDGMKRECSARFVVGDIKKTTDSSQQEVQPTIIKEYQPHFKIGYHDEAGRSREKTLNHSNLSIDVVGVQYRDNYEALVANLSEGDILTIKLDPDNEKDSTALGFYTEEGDLLGYVKKGDKPAVDLFFKNKELKAKVLYAEEDDVQTEVVVTKRDLNEEVTSKYDYRFCIVKKVKTETYYSEGSSLCELEDIIDSLND